MKFSRSQTHDFPLEVSFFDNKFLEVVSSMKLLGVIVSDSLKWGPNTDYICKRAKAKIWLLQMKKLKMRFKYEELLFEYLNNIHFWKISESNIHC